LDPDGTSFWAAEGSFERTRVHRIDFDSPSWPSRFYFNHWESPGWRGKKVEAIGVSGEIRAGAAPTVGISDAEIVEPASGSKTMDFTVSLSAPVAVPLTVKYFTQDGPAQNGARAGTDYQQVSGGTVTIPAGEVEIAASVEVLADTDAGEAPETFSVNLVEDSDLVSNRRPLGTGTIYDNVVVANTDEAPTQGESPPGPDVAPPPGVAPNPGVNPATSPAPGPSPAPVNSPSPVLNPTPQPQPVAPVQPIVQPQPAPTVQGNQPFQGSTAPQVQAQNFTQSQQQVHGQQASQAQSAGIVDRQRQTRVQTAGNDGSRGDTLLASSARTSPSPAPLLGWVASLMGLAVGLAWKVGSRPTVCRSTSSARNNPNRRPASRQVPRHHREWGQRPL